MSIVLVTFPAAPGISEEAVQKEKELEEYLKKHVIGKFFLSFINHSLSQSKYINTYLYCGKWVRSAKLF